MALSFKNIKSLFVVEEEEDANKTSEEKKTIVQKEKSTEPKIEDKKSEITWKSTSSNKIVSEQNKTKPIKKEQESLYNQKIFESLTKAITKANLPGEDYIEYLQAMKAMKDLPLEEHVKIQTVLATLSTKGLTKQKLFESADYYLEVLSGEKQKFYSAFEGQAKGNISKKQSDIRSLENANKAKAQQIAKLTEEIKQNQQKIDLTKKEISEAESKMKKAENSFIYTYNKVADQIKANIDKIKNIG